jgi:hypothetical protein
MRAKTAVEAIDAGIRGWSNAIPRVASGYRLSFTIRSVVRLSEGG